MKRKLLFAALMAVWGVGQSFAQYTTSDLVTAGWEAVDGTTVTLTDLDTYYYLLVDGTETNKSLTYSGVGTDARPVYQLLYDPTISVGQVWKLEASGDKFKMKSAVNDWYYCSNSWGWNSYMGTNESYTEHEFVLNDGKYYIHVKDEGGTTRALGAWGDYNLNGGGLGYAGTAGNKDVGGSNDRGFYIYRLPRTDYVAAPKPSTQYAAKGWMEVTAMADWGVAGLQYVFLDISETGFETEMVMTATENGLPQYQRSAMTKAQWWTTEASGSGYAFKSVEYQKYSNYTAPWGGNMSDAVPGNVFVPSLANGKWAMKNTSDNGNWLGRWGDSDNGKNAKNDPFAGEQLASNKGINNGRRLYNVYAIPTAVEMAEPLPATGDMAADTWYYFDTAIAGNAYAATATNLADITCYSYATPSTAITLTETGNSLEATRYYVKSITANNLVIAATSFSYVIGTPTATPADGAVIKPGQTITVTISAQTDEPGVSPTVDFSGVTFGGSAATVTTDGTGFTFTVPATVTAGQSYTLEIPAGAVAYTGEASSEAATFTYSTPAFFDGVYYVRNADPNYEYKYITCQGSWATQASVQDYGLAVHLSINDQGRTRMQFFDTEQWLGDDGFCYTDCDDGRSRYYSVEPQADGSFKFFNTNNSKYLAVYQGQVIGDAVEGDNLEGTSNLWILDTPADYAQNCIARLAQKQIETVATAAGLTGITTGAALEAEFGMSSAVTLPNIARQEKSNYQVTSYDGSGFTARDLLDQQTVTGLSDGVYKLTFKGFQRGASYARVDAAEGARGEIYVYANDTKQTLVSAMEEGAATAYADNYASLRTGLNYPNNAASAYAAFDAGLYNNEVYVYVTGGTLKFGIQTPRRSPNNDNSWAVFGDFELTFFFNDLTPLISEYEAALAAAKTTSAKTDKMAASLRTALDNTITTYDEGQVDETSQAALETAINALKAATAKSETSLASYAIIAAGSVPIPNDKDYPLDGWVCENSNAFHINTWSTEGNSDGSEMRTPFIENWVGKGSYLGAGKVYYRLEGLEPGEVYYAEALVRSYNEANSDAPNGPNFYINDVVTDLSTDGTTFTYNGMSGIYATLGGGATIGADGILELGVVIAADRNYNWVAFKNIQIMTFDAALAAAVARVEALDGNVPATTYANVGQAAIDNCQGANYPTTAAGFETAIADLTSAAEALEPLVEPFAGYLALKAIADFNVLADCDDDVAQQDFSVAISTAETAANAATTAEGIEAANEQLKTDMNTFVDNTNPVNDSKYNLTYKLTNPDVTNFPSWAKVPGYNEDDALNTSGWFTEQPDGNFQVMNNDAATSEDGTKTKFIEYWSWNAKANGLFDLYTKVTLPEGTYQMTCYAVAKDEGHDGENKKGVYFYVNDTQGSLVDNVRLAPKEVEFVNPSEGEVKVGLKSMSPNTYNWVGIGYVELYKVPENVIVIDPDENDYDYTCSKAGKVILRNRAIKVGYNTLVLPFNLTQAQVEATFGEGSKISYLKAYNAETNALSFTSKNAENEVIGLAANRPCLLKATLANDEGDDIEFENIMLIPAEGLYPTDAITGATMYGTYKTSTKVPVNSWFVQNNTLVYAPEDSETENGLGCWINLGRAYITLDGWTPESSVKALTLTFDDEEATGIAVVENGALKVLDGQAYDLSGRAVKNPTKGLYIINGQKVFLK